MDCQSKALPIEVQASKEITIQKKRTILVEEEEAFEYAQLFLFHLSNLHLEVYDIVFSYMIFLTFWRFLPMLLCSGLEIDNKKVKNNRYSILQKNSKE